MKSAFATWFKAQFGRLPLSPEKYLNLRDEVGRKERELERLRIELREETSINEAYQGALYAWQITDEKKTVREW